MIRNLFFSIVGKIIAACPWLVDAIIKRAQRTPYFDIVAPDGTVYMRRWWLFNPYDNETYKSRRPWLPNIRVHQILRPDSDRHLHDHPWNARTIVMRGGYVERRESTQPFKQRLAGYSGLLKFGEYHRISLIVGDAAWTIFITYRYRGTWGFKVDGVKVPHREYLAAKNGGAQ